MTMDYYSILSKAIANAEDVAKRHEIYSRARNAVAALRPGPDLSADQISIEVLALEDAIRQIEDSLDQPQRSDDSFDEMRNINVLEPAVWKRVGLSAAALVLVVGLLGSVYWYTSGGATKPENGPAASSRASLALRDRIAPDLEPGVDGGSSAANLPFTLQRQVVFYRTTVVPGSIVVDREKRLLYLVQSGNSARRYAVGITPECLKSGSLYRVANKMEWPAWQAPLGGDIKQATASRSMPGGPGNPLGSRSLVLDQPDRFIHGTNSPDTIGRLTALGCIRLVNEDVEDLYRRVVVETKVIMRN